MRARLSERIGYQMGRFIRAVLAFAVCGAFLALFW
jgi:hypothetical protein